MAYSDLQNNQTVSYTNLQSGVAQGAFTAKTTIPTSNRQVTKSEVNVYVNINTSLPTYTAKGSNQLITKQDLSGITTVSPYLMYGVATYLGYKSIDGGATWSVLPGLTIYDLDWTSIAGDSTGNYIAAVSRSVNNQVYMSTNGGDSFTAVTIEFIATIGFFPYSVSMSNNGQYINIAGITFNENSNPSALAIPLHRTRIATSSNYGSSFNAGYYTDSQSLAINATRSTRISTSGNGQYMTAVFSYDVDPGFPNKTRPWSFKVFSSNYGSSWTRSDTSEYFNFNDIAIDLTGQNQFITSDYDKPGFLGDIGIAALVTNNYGANWSVRYSNLTNALAGGRYHNTFLSATISDNGQVFIGCANNFFNPDLPPIVITSINQGVTFSQSEGYYDNAGMAGGNVTTTGVTNNYAAIMFNNIGQFNYSTNGGFSFLVKASVSYPWNYIYRKAFLYSGNSNPLYGTFLYDQCVNCDLYAFRADGNGGSYQAEVMQYNTEACCFGGGGGEL